MTEDAATPSTLFAKLRAPALLVGLGVLFLCVFAWQRNRSAFFAAEARVEEAKLLAERNDVPLREVLALHELLGGHLPALALSDRVNAFANQRRKLGDELLAVLAVRGRGILAGRLAALARNDRARLRRLVSTSRAAVDDAVRFASVAERYAARGH